MQSNDPFQLSPGDEAKTQREPCMVWCEAPHSGGGPSAAQQIRELSA